MINFAISLLLAFLVLVIVQRHGGYMLDQEDNSCLVAGHLLVYFFLSAFVWMTLMSFVIFNQIYHVLV